MFKIIIKAVDNKSLNLYWEFLKRVLQKLESVDIKTVYLPTIKKRITLLKSPHVYKTAREQFQYTIFRRFIEINSSLESSLLKILLINKPKNITY